MEWFLGAALAISALVGLGSAISSGIQSRKNRKSQEEANKKNLELSVKEFEEQKYLNRNANQIQLSDMQKAGLNPALGSLGSLSGSSVSAGQVGTQGSFDMSAMSEFASQLVQVAAQKHMQNQNIAAQKDITEMNNDNQLQIASMQEQTKRDLAALERQRKTAEFRQELEQRKLEHSEKLAESQYQYDSSSDFSAYTYAQNTNQKALDALSAFEQDESDIKRSAAELFDFYRNGDNKASITIPKVGTLDMSGLERLRHSSENTFGQALDFVLEKMGREPHGWTPQSFANAFYDDLHERMKQRYLRDYRGPGVRPRSRDDYIK